MEKWLVIYPKGESGFAVANSGSTTITLLGPDDSEIDKFTYIGSSEDKSWGRIPDGGEINSEKLSPTAGGANEAPPTPTPTPTTLSSTLTSTPTPTIGTNCKTYGYSSRYQETNYDSKTCC